MKLIEQYKRNIVLKSSSKKSSITLFDYIIGVFTGRFDDTDNDSSNQSNEMAYLKDEGHKEVEAGSDEIVDEPTKQGLIRNDSVDYKASTP